MAAGTTDADTTTTAAPSTNLPAKKSPARGPKAEGADPHRHRHAVEHAVDSNTTHLDLDLGSAHLHLTLPPLDKLAYYLGLGGAAAFGVIEWPIALAAGVGHLLSDNRRHRTLAALGEALDAV